MKIQSVEVYITKFNRHYKLRGVQDSPNLIPNTDYFFEPHWSQVYSRKMETCIIKIATDNGIVGWGEAQAPILPEVAATIILYLLGPFLIGKNPLQHEKLNHQMYHMMEVRGHGNSFFQDAIAAIDIALWDIKGKHYNAPIFELLGGPFKLELPAYVSGLRQATLEEQAVAAKGFIDQGYQGIKLLLGHGLKQDIHVVETIREAVGPDAELYLDVLWKYTLPEAIQLEKKLRNLNVGFIEAPMSPNDLKSHIKLVQKSEIAIAVGEPFRTVHEIGPWMESDAMHVIQPDVMRCGITTTMQISEIARGFYKKVAPHIGICSSIGIAATWQLSASLSHFSVQEFQLDMFDIHQEMLEKPLQVEGGKLIVPQAPGLGIQVKENYIEQHTEQHWRISASGFEAIL